MESWIIALLSAGVGTGVALLVREWLIARVTIWSLTADDAGRKHALALLRLLRAQVRRGPEQPAEPQKDELPPRPKDPPTSGSAGGIAA